MLRCSTKESESPAQTQRLERTCVADIGYRPTIDHPSALVLHRSRDKFLPYLASNGRIHFLPSIVRCIHSAIDQAYSLWHGSVRHFRWTQSTAWLCAGQRRRSISVQCLDLYASTYRRWSTSGRIRSLQCPRAWSNNFMGISREDWSVVHCFGFFLLVLPSIGSRHSMSVEVSQETSRDEASFTNTRNSRWRYPRSHRNLPYSAICIGGRPTDGEWILDCSMHSYVHRRNRP